MQRSEAMLLQQGMPLNELFKKNSILAAVPVRYREALLLNMDVSQHEPGTVLIDEGDQRNSVLFPLSGMVSFVIPMQDGTMTEAAKVGSEGAIGPMAAFGLTTFHLRGIVWLPMRCARIPARDIAAVADASSSARALLWQANEMLLLQASTAAACNALHAVEQRFSRWLLETADRAEGSDLPVTQETVGELLGVRRNSISPAARRMAEAGIISYRRGRIQILNRERLLRRCCECYDNLDSKSRSLMSDPIGPSSWWRCGVTE